jgi:hypothetical protein
VSHLEPGLSTRRQPAQGNTYAHEDCVNSLHGYPHFPPLSSYRPPEIREHLQFKGFYEPFELK